MKTVNDYLEFEKAFRKRQEAAIAQQRERDRPRRDVTGKDLVRFFVLVLGWSGIIAILTWEILSR